MADAPFPADGFRDVVILDGSSDVAAVVPLESDGSLSEAAWQQLQKEGHKGFVRWSDSRHCMVMPIGEDPTASFAPATNSDLCPVKLTLLGEPRPPSMDIFLQPESIQDLPDAWSKHFNHVAEGVRNSYHWRYAITEEEVTLLVSPGTYRIGGDFQVLEDLLDPEFVSVAVQKVTKSTSGGPLPGDTYQGFLVSISEATELTLYYSIL